MSRPGKSIVAALCILASALLAGPASAAEEETHIFDPVLSLTGNCSTSSVDPVPDPGTCPMPPGVPGVDHPSKVFSAPRAVATDSHGNIFVAATAAGSGPRVEIFDPEGFFIGEIGVASPYQLAVDSAGHLYVGTVIGDVYRYEPSLYEPADGHIAYDDPPTTLTLGCCGVEASVAVNPLNDHLFVWVDGKRVSEYGSAAEGSPLLYGDPLLSVLGKGIGEDTLDASRASGLAIDPAHGKIYVSDRENAPGGGVPVIRVFELEAPHELLDTFLGTITPIGQFKSYPSLAVDEETGNFFTYDLENPSVAYEFTAAGEYVSTITPSGGFKATGGSQIWFDNGALSPNRGYLYVASHVTGVGHVFAFSPPPEQCPPEVKSLALAAVTQGEAELRAQVNPCGLQTDYELQYTTEASFGEVGFANAQSAGNGQLPVGGSAVEVAAVARGLTPGTAYRFRVLASNEEGSDEADSPFTTYREADPSPPCPNEARRTGSLALPDCRAYELLTPADTNGHEPLFARSPVNQFPGSRISPDGGAVSVTFDGGALPGLDATGNLYGDPYLLRRGPTGWTTTYTGPSPVESTAIAPGSTSPDQGYSFWATAGTSGSAVVNPSGTLYVRYPDGHSELIGRGSLGSDPSAVGHLISQGGGHIVFATGTFPGGTAVQLEPDAPPSGTLAVYDRTGDETTHVVSLLPGDVTPGAGEGAHYRGASLDGKGVAFTIGGKLYLRHDNEETYEVGDGVEFAGIAEGGARVAYLENGDLYAFDVDGEERTRFTTSGDVTPVNVSADGSAAYFVSPTVLSGDANPEGDLPQAGQQNLYLSREGAIAFLGGVSERDVEGELLGGQVLAEGLGLWLEAVQTGKSGKDPSRTTPDGQVLLFESRANLTGYDSGGEAQVYRYDTLGPALDCLSCSPTGVGHGEGNLQSLRTGETGLLIPEVLVGNLRADGERAFFESTDALVLADTDGLRDVYEWEAKGVGTCTRPEGCLYLISSGKSAREDYLYAVSESGEDVIFSSGDLLLPALDPDTTPSLYDARVNGGFPTPTPPPAECLGEACQPAPAAPADPTPALRGAGNVSDKPTSRRCPKGKRRARRAGKTRCVKRRHQERQRHRRAARANGRAAR
ncbi:MAG TPA: hypothetical protein VIS95_03440 [Solirubrobacterales bacterium]